MKSINIGTPRDLPGVLIALVDIVKAINRLISSPFLEGHFPSTATTVTPYSVLPSDSVLRIDTTAGNKTLNLPPAANNTGHILFVKKLTTDANSTETIDGALTLVIAGGSRGAVIVYCNGVSWDILSAS